ncbi:MAG: hypothetical protein IJ856_07550, partial [Candidatus Methanomethylophilaceae archaeon]|nr:hypothetical protein [Candidatus Methanomethylophilaceae archaeon]
LDSRLGIMVDVRLDISDDALSFHNRHGSLIILSREPIDWKGFREGEPAPEDGGREAWSSFYS